LRRIKRDAEWLSETVAAEDPGEVRRLAREIRSDADELSILESRLAALERDSHPPIDLAPAFEDILAERGFLKRGAV
jgi:hypothetical protein